MDDAEIRAKVAELRAAHGADHPVVMKCVGCDGWGHVPGGAGMRIPCGECAGQGTVPVLPEERDDPARLARTSLWVPVAY